MKSKSSSAHKAETIAKRPKAATRTRRKSRSFEDVVGAEVYRTWVSMLQTLVPDGRTHRLAVLLAAMLQFATDKANDLRENDLDEGSLADALLTTGEVSDSSEVKALIHDAVTQLFKDARVISERASSRGHKYSIADDAYEEYLHWHNMPWE